MDLTARRGMVLAGLGSALLLGGAYLFQALGYAPCAICLWQRWPHFLAVAVGAAAVFRTWRWLAWVGVLATLTTACFGIYHTGIERGWWPGPSSCSGGSDLSGMSGSDLLSADTLDRVVMCDEVAWSFAGLSMASWNAVLSLVLMGIWLSAALAPRRI